MTTLIEAIKTADEVEIDATWAVLKYTNIGILRKLKIFAMIYGLEEEVVIQEAPKDAEGRILDKTTRHTIHDVLIKVSQQ